MTQLITPDGGARVNLIRPGQRNALNLPSLDLDWRQQCELELLMSGAYSPLTGFMTRAQRVRVEIDRQLDKRTFWPLPITFSSMQAAPAALKPGDRVALRDAEGFMLAVLTISDVREAQEGRHLGGAVTRVALPAHSDFGGLRATLAELRARRCTGRSTSSA